MSKGRLTVKEVANIVADLVRVSALDNQDKRSHLATLASADDEQDKSDDKPAS